MSIIERASLEPKEAKILDEIEKVVGRCVDFSLAGVDPTSQTSDDWDYPHVGINNGCIDVLILRNCNTTNLIESICKLKSLRILDLSFNQLTALPESIGDLKALKELTLTGNRLEMLPESLYQLKNLNQIFLSQNDWKEEWKEVLKADVPTILKLCRKLHGMYIFISHAMEDGQKYHILELNKFLEKNVIVRENDMKMNIIHDVLICEEDLIDDIWDFMTENIPKSHLLLFIATNNSIVSEPCRYELFLASKYEIEILPIKGKNIIWNDLRKISLIDRNKKYQGNLDLSNPKKKFEFDGKNFDKICKRLRKYIKTHESELKRVKKELK